MKEIQVDEKKGMEGKKVTSIVLLILSIINYLFLILLGSTVLTKFTNIFTDSGVVIPNFSKLFLSDWSLIYVFVIFTLLIKEVVISAKAALIVNAVAFVLPLIILVFTIIATFLPLIDMMNDLK